MTWKTTPRQYLAMTLAALGALVGCSLQSKRPTNAQPEPAPEPQAGTTWYASPTGSTSGAGTMASPFALKTALAGASGKMKPGDSVFLLNGVYKGPNLLTVSGTSSAYITFRSAPGQWAILDLAGIGQTKDRAPGPMKITGRYILLRDLELMNSEPTRTRNSPYSGVLNSWRPGGCLVYGTDNQIVNVLSHDNGSGISPWTGGGNPLVYGCLIYVNGCNKNEHGSYSPNDGSGIYSFIDNVYWANSGVDGPHLYSKAYGYNVEGNTIFMSSQITKPDAGGRPILAYTSGGVTKRLTVKANMLYCPYNYTSSKNGAMKFGDGKSANQDITLTDNYIATGSGMFLYYFSTWAGSNNTWYCGNGTTIVAKLNSGGTRSYDNNTYCVQYSGSPPAFSYNGASKTLASWQSSTGLDKNSKIAPRPRQNVVFIRPNQYEKGRAYVTIYNWEHLAAVPVDLGSVLIAGQPYEVRDTQNIHTVLLKGTAAAGQVVAFPMRTTAVEKVIGNIEVQTTHTSDEFGCFLVQTITPQSSSPGALYTPNTPPSRGRGRGRGRARLQPEAQDAETGGDTGDPFSEPSDTGEPPDARTSQQGTTRQGP